MLKLYFTSQFKKDFKLIKKRHLPLNELKNVLNILAEGNILPEKYRDHSLTGDWKGFRECHIQPDWLLIYRTNEDRLELIAQRTGSHADLFS